MAYRTREFPKLFAGGAYPPNTLLMIDRLVREEFLIEVSAVAGAVEGCISARFRAHPAATRGRARR